MFMYQNWMYFAEHYRECTQTKCILPNTIGNVPKLNLFCGCLCGLIGSILAMLNCAGITFSLYLLVSCYLNATHSLCWHWFSFSYLKLPTNHDNNIDNDHNNFTILLTFIIFSTHCLFWNPVFIRSFCYMYLCVPF